MHSEINSGARGNLGLKKKEREELSGTVADQNLERKTSYTLSFLLLEMWLLCNYSKNEVIDDSKLSESTRQRQRLSPCLCFHGG